jgi:PAS domain S-box-containing protein
MSEEKIDIEKNHKEPPDSMTEYLPITFFQTDNNLILKYANQKGLDTFGYNIEDLGKGISILDLVVQDDREKAKYNIKAIINCENIRGNEYTGLKKNGKVFPIFVFTTALYVKSEFVGLHGAVIDLSYHTNLNEKIRKSEERFRSIFNGSPLGIGIVEFHSQKIIDVNDSFASMLGYTREELIKLCLSDITHPDDFEKEVSDVTLGLNSSLPIVIEKRYLTKQGEVIWARLYLSPKNLELSQSNQFLGIIENITDQKNASLELSRSKQRYKHLAESINDIFFSFDSDFNFTYWNKKSADLFGLPYTEVIGKNIYKIFNDIKGTALDQFYINTMASGNTSELINRVIIGGKEEYFEVNAHPHEKGLTVFLKNITERIFTEQRLKESEERFRLLADNLPQFVWITSAENILTYINKTLSDYLGMNIHELNLENWTSRIHPLDFDTYTKVNHEAYLKRQKYEIEYRFKNKMGDYRWIVDIATPRFTKENQFLGFVGSCFDITERKDAERAIHTFIDELQTHKKLLEDKAEELSVINYKLQESEYQLKNLNASKDKFFSIVAHDLRSPFHGLIGMSNILLEEYDELDKESVKTFLSNINNSTKNLFKLVENLLSWSRLQTGKLEFNPEKIDLFESVLYSINLLKANAENKQISLINKISQAVYVYADEKILISILENFISNAIKFSYTGGRIEISYEERGEDVFVHIQDWGVGISEDNKKLLFRLDTGFTTAGTNNEHGTGFGLLLCKDMVELLSGKISLQSQKGKGSTFTFSLKKQR